MRNILLSILIPVLLLLCGCSSNKVTDFDDVNGEQFPYECPVTAVTDAGDSLILGTSRGDIVSYNLSDGSFKHVYHDSKGRFVYNIIKCSDGSLIYSVQNGGINHVAADGTVTVYEITPEKGCNYSAYRMIHDDGHLYAATSNGVYHWTMPQTRGVRLDVAVQEDLNDVISSRFYSIEADGQAYICSGEAGQYSIEADGNVKTIDTASISSSHDGIILYKDGRVVKEGKLLAQLQIPALDFVSDGVHIYALSLYSIEILDALSGQHLMTVNMPDERGPEKNLSCRSFCMIKGDYLYITPGGCALYRMPLYRHWINSEEVVQVCAAADGDVYLLTCENDLFRFDSADMEVEYRRSFENSEDVELIGAAGDVLLVTFDGVYYELSGKRLTDERELYELNAWKRGKVLWHLMNDGILYQGQVDKIRMYDRASGWKLLREVEKDVSMNADTTVSEYYPQRASFSNNILIVNTMHYGTFSFDSERFDTVPGMQDLVIKDLEGDDAAIFALTDEKVVLNSWPKASVNIMFTNDSHKHFNVLLPLNSKSFLAFSTYSRWCRGVNFFREDPEKPEEDWVVMSCCSAHTVNDAVRSGSYAVAGGTMGLAVISSDGSVTVMPVPEPTFFQKNILAWNYPWGIVIYAMALLAALSVMVWCVIVCRRHYLKYRYARMYDDFYRWVKSTFRGSYVRNLAKHLKKISADRARLAANMNMFRSQKAELLKLDDIMMNLEECQKWADGNKPKKLRFSSEDEYNEGVKEYNERLKKLVKAPVEELVKMCSDTHPFGYSIIHEWGKRRSRLVTLMLLPLSPKIRFIEVCDPAVCFDPVYVYDEKRKIEVVERPEFAIARPGAEKMSFKDFMDRNMSRILERDLEIRDLIALSAYEAIISEKASADA